MLAEENGPIPGQKVQYLKGLPSLGSEPTGPRRSATSRAQLSVPHFTPHERELLLALLAKGDATNTDLAKQLRISPTAARKIRLKLEKNGVIRGYRPVLDLTNLGVQVFSLVEVRLLPAGWKAGGGAGVQTQLARHENVVAVYRLPEGQTTHAILAGFRNLEESDRFLHVLQSNYPDLLEIRRTFTFSSRSVIKDDPRGILTKVLLEWDEMKLPKGLDNLPSRLPTEEAE